MARTAGCTVVSALVFLGTVTVRFQKSTDALTFAKRGAITEVGTSHRPPGLNAVL